MRRWLPTALACCFIGIASATGFFFWPHSLESATPSDDQPSGAALIAKGQYLTLAADCAACHTAPGGKPFAGGLAFKLPFGAIFSPNITPDRETGIGNWTDAEFVRALRRGVSRDGKDLYPAFPYTSYALLSTDDALAIRAYLATLMAVRWQSPDDQLSFPFNQRYFMRAWKLLFLPKHQFAADKSQKDGWNRGAYLAEALAHCGECHTPRNILFALKADAKFAGAAIEGWKAYNITPDPETGVGNWTDAELVDYLSTGHATGHGGAVGGMAEAIHLSLRHLGSNDIADMVTYLRTVPPLRSQMTDPIDSHPISLSRSTPWSPPPNVPESQGQRIFESACASCHGWDGSGQQVQHAALRGARTVNDPDGSNLVRVILQGSNIGSQQGDFRMPSFGRAYTDAEIAAVSNYVLNQFGAKSGRVTPADVAAARGG